MSTGKHCCSDSYQKCSAIKQKNSTGVKLAHKEGRVPGWNDLGERGNRGWAKGLTKETDQRVLNNSKIQRGKPKRGHPMSEKNKILARERRLKIILNGEYDSSGRKGHRGHYAGQYFHSSWELAFYVYETEVNHRRLSRNSTIMIDYVVDGKTFKYVPDFITATGELLEVKGYLHGSKDIEKYMQSKDNVRYFFKNDIKLHLVYCEQKYSKRFWEQLYTDD